LQEEAAAMAQNFLSCDREQSLLLPPDLRDWLDEDHLAWFVIEAIDELDLESFYCTHRGDGHGADAARAGRFPEAPYSICRPCPPLAKARAETVSTELDQKDAVEGCAAIGVLSSDLAHQRATTVDPIVPRTEADVALIRGRARADSPSRCVVTFAFACKERRKLTTRQGGPTAPAGGVAVGRRG
jgi:hypothetical protein